MDLENKVKETIKKYNLLQKKDKIIVALSGGKDSVVVLYLLKKLGYNIQALMIDMKIGGWSKINRENMERFCKELAVSLVVIDFNKECGYGLNYIKEIMKEDKGLSGCSVCGILRRWILNKYAKKLGADKIATGHNLDDECQTVLMNFLKGNILLGLNSTPLTGSSDALKAGFVQRIKPLFFIPESEILDYSRKMNFPILYDKCPCAFGTYRIETRDWLKIIKEKEKLKIVQGFQKLIPELRKRYLEKINNCGICGEPSRKEICNACKILEAIS